MVHQGSLITIRASLYLGDLVEQIDNFLETVARVKEPARTRYVEYILLRAAYEADLFYTSKLEMQLFFDEKAQRLFNAIAAYVKDEIYRQARLQLGHAFFYGCEYELSDAQFFMKSLRLTLHLMEKGNEETQ